MRRWFSVRATDLHKRELCWEDRLIRQCTLFPFFDGGGAVEQVLVVDADSSELRAFRLDATRVAIPYAGPICLEGAFDRIDEFVTDQLAPLWHFDPWWLLKDTRFDSHVSVSSLKLTNCVGVFNERPADVVFSSHLLRLKKLRYDIPVNSPEENVSGYFWDTLAGTSSEEIQESRPFRVGMLPDRDPASHSDVATKAGWQLTPFWHSSDA